MDVLQDMCVCMYVIFIRCDKRTSNNKHIDIVGMWSPEICGPYIYS